MAARERDGDWIVGGGCGGWRDVTARQFFSSKIDALTSAASSARCHDTEKKGHVNYDISDVPVEARAAPTTGSGCHGSVLAARDDAKNSRFFRWERAEAEARDTPRRRDRRCRACREGSWEGGGSLVGAGDSVVPCGGHEVSRRWKLHHRVVQFMVF